VTDRDKSEYTRRSFLGLTAKAGTAAATASLLEPLLRTTGAYATTNRSTALATSKPSLSVLNNLTDPGEIKALQETVTDYNAAATSTAAASLNTVAAAVFVPQLPTYLTESNPPSAILYWGGHTTSQFGDKGYLLNLSSIWNTELAHYSPAMKALATDDRGKQVFVPQSYYWWGIFYRKSVFKKLGVTAPNTWAQLIDVCEKIQKQNVHPFVTAAAPPEPWPFVGWFDYLDLRLNGAKFHLDLLHGKHSFNSPQVKEVFVHLSQILRYFDPNSASYAYQDAATPFVQGTAAMYLMGALVTGLVPSNIVDDIDFFRFPTIDSTIPDAEEAPTNGYIAPAKVMYPAQTKNLLAFLVSDKAQEIYTSVSGSSAFPVSRTARVSLTPLEKKGLAMLQQAKAITQFFNRDSSDALQTTNYNAMEAFWESPGNIDSILATWQTAASKVFQQGV
jgi:multiple sugar transport system substrate-binding protein